MRVRGAKNRDKVLAVASSGGHWVQMLRILPAFDAADLAFVSVIDSYRNQVPNHRFYCVTDATRWNRARLLKLAIRMAFIVLKERPDVVVSTGAAPGYFAILFGRLIGARTIWIDSMANAEHLSMAGQLAGKHADLWLTQWPHLARPQGPHYGGSVL